MGEKKTKEQSENAEVAIAWGTLSQLKQIHTDGQEGAYIYARRTDAGLRAGSIGRLKSALGVVGGIKNRLTEGQKELIAIARNYLQKLEQIN